MSIEAELILEIKALRGAVERVGAQFEDMQTQQERATTAVEQLAVQFDNITSGGNAMTVEVVT